MAYCPQCLVEYEQGSRECSDCRVPLVSGPPPGHGNAARKTNLDLDLDLVVVRTFMGADASLRAELARNLLQAHGITATLMGEISIRVMPFHGLALLRVERNNLERATEILESFLDNSEFLAEEMPDDED